MSEIIAIIGGYLILGLVVATAWVIVEGIPSMIRRAFREAKKDED